METPHFIFWEAIKAFGLIFLALLAAKIISALPISSPKGSRRAKIVKPALILLVVALVVLGAKALGTDVAAEIYYSSALGNLAHGEVPLACSNASRAVARRPRDLRYWEALDRAKVAARQYASALQDEPALRALAGGVLDADDAARFATCRYQLGQFGEVVSDTQRILQKDRFYPFAYLLQGMAYIALKQYSAAEDSLLRLLGMFPTQADGVAELAQAYYLAGDLPRALAVLDATRRYTFPPQARARFEELKAFYAQ
ncbi:MAG: hypothetical protein ACRD1N_08595 [Terriglobia bacterium]